MKKVLKITARASLFVALTVLFTKLATAQEQLNTTWEGMFMNDFKVVLTIPSDMTRQQQGHIKMYAGDNMIQDDELTQIIQTDRSLEFYIPAKETLFSGEIQASGMEVEVIGYFIFPDSSRHPLQVHKITQKSSMIDDPEFRNVPYYDAMDLQSDMDFLYKQLKEYHPQLYAYTSRKTMEKQLHKLQSQLKGSIPLDEFYRIAAQFTDLVHCSHTGVRMAHTDQSSTNQLAHFFPLNLFFDDGKAYYVSGPEVEIGNIQPGAEILCINNRPIQQVIKQLMPLIPAEGHNQTTKYAELNQRFRELFLYLDESKSYFISYREDQAIKQMTVVACIENVFQSPAWNGNNPVEYSMYSAIPVLKIGSFAIGDINGYIHQLDQLFNRITANQVTDLILDLRGNAGGHPIFAAQLLSYFVSDSFTYFKRNDAIEEFEPLYNPMSANPLHFEGNLYVLVDGGCLSTTGHLISLLDLYTDAYFIGEEPGSTYQCNDFSLSIRLPATGLEVNVPRTTFETHDAGLSDRKPFSIDAAVSSSVEDIIHQNDPYLQKAASILQKKSL